ncbi:hypothetical protein V5799_020813 [Amblyomma americanum]|uniref:Peptidase M12B domain-containing protein n=1 Tax=Amblyomma americanum TaxID=6943 RepID=A0AAQ4ESW4_AMBAM
MMAVAVVFGLFVQLASHIYAAPASKILSERIVYPLHLESRADTGERVVRITDDLELNLEKTRLFGDEVTVVGFDGDNNEVALSMPGHEAEKSLYHDTKRLAAVHLTHDDGFQVEGVLGPRFRIRPLPAAERSSDGHVAHLLFEVEEKRENDPMQRSLRDQLQSRDISSSYNNSFKARSLLPEERQSRIIYPELTIFCDAPFTEHFRSNYTKILRYMTVFMTSVNLRYLSLTDPYVWNIPVYIVALNRENEIYMSLSGDYVYDTLTLDNMPKKLSNYYYYTATDISVTVTARDIISYYGETHTAGYAYTGTACGSLKVAITEETPGTYNGIRLFAHELAHVLGAQHDGDPPLSYIEGHPGALSCPWSDGYIMSYASNRPENYHRFSYCSQLQIRHTVNQKGRECLHTINVQTEVKPIYKLPSEMITLESFCRYVYRKTKGELTFYPDRGQENCKVYCKEKHSSMMWIFDRPDGFKCNHGREHITKKTRKNSKLNIQDFS